MLKSPKSFTHIREHSRGGAVHVGTGGMSGGPHLQSDGPGVSGTDTRFFSQDIRKAIHPDYDGGDVERDRFGDRLYSER